METNLSLVKSVGNLLTLRYSQIVTWNGLAVPEVHKMCKLRHAGIEER